MVLWTSLLVHGLAAHKPQQSLSASKDATSQFAKAIPLKLLFTFRIDLSSLPADASDDHRVLASNVKNTIEAHNESGQAILHFYDDAACEEVINATEPALLQRFREEHYGAYKADICRGAFMWQEGGLYFDVDM